MADYLYSAALTDAPAGMVARASSDPALSSLVDLPALADAHIEVHTCAGQVHGHTSCAQAAGPWTQVRLTVPELLDHPGRCACLAVLPLDDPALVPVDTVAALLTAVTIAHQQQLLASDAPVATGPLIEALHLARVAALERGGALTAFTDRMFQLAVARAGATARDELSSKLHDAGVFDPHDPSGTLALDLGTRTPVTFDAYRLLLAYPYTIAGPGQDLAAVEVPAYSRGLAAVCDAVAAPVRLSRSATVTALSLWNADVHGRARLDGMAWTAAATVARDLDAA